MTPFPWWRRRRDRGSGQEAGQGPPPPATGEVPPGHGGTARHVVADGRNAIGVGGNVNASAVGPGATVNHIHLGAGPGVPGHPPDERRIEQELARYAARVRSSYGRLDLEVLIPRQEWEHPAVGLREVFVPPLLRADPPPVELPRELRERLVGNGDVPPRETLPPGLDQEWLDRLRRAYRERPAVEALEVLADPRQGRVVLLGDPGAGKSTLAHYLALALTTGPPPAPLAGLAGRVPVVLELRKYADARWRDRSFEDHLDHVSTMEGMSVPRDVLTVLLRAGRAMVVFDGLDELFDPAVRAEAGRRIAAFAEQYPETRIVVTSRVIGYHHAELRKAGFAHFMIQDLTRYQIAEFVRRWYAVVCPDDPQSAARLRGRLTDTVASSRPVRELAGNPLLLTILSIIGRRQELPRDRHGVYRHAVDILVAHWDQDAKYLQGPAPADALRHLDDEDRRELLRLLARRMQDGAYGIAGNHIHGQEVEAVFTAYLEERYGMPRLEAAPAGREMIRQFRERNFILSRFGDEVYGFVHRAFLEYLAADDIARRYQRDREWGEAELVREVFVRRAGDPAWHEVLLLLIGQLGERDAARVIDALLGLHARELRRRGHDMLVLAVRVLAEVRRDGMLAAQSAAVVDALIDSLERNLGRTAQRSLEGMLPALAVLGPRWSGRRRYLRWYALRGQFQSRHPLPPRIACALHSGPEALLLLAEHSPAPARAEVLRAVIGRWPDLPGAWRLVLEGVDAPDAASRQGAMENLGRWWHEDEGVRGLLFDRAASDPDPGPRRSALEALAERWRGDGDARELVLRQAAADPDPGCRREALGLLRHHWPDHPDTWRVIADRATADPDPGPRQGALQLLAGRHGESGGLRELLLDRAASDPDPGPRREAADALARHWSSDPEARDLILRQAVADPDPEPRRGALEALAWRWQDHEGVRELLVRRAVEDPEPQPRAEALEALAWRWSDSEDVRELILRRASADPHPDPRRLALQFLAYRWGEHGQVRELLFERAAADPGPGPRQEASWLLAEVWEERHGVRELLLGRATADPARGPREVALQLLARHWPGDEEVRNLVLDRMTADPEPDLRRNALHWAAWLMEAEPAVYEAIRAAAVADPSGKVRKAALRVPAFGWPRLPATVGLLRERAVEDEDGAVREAAARALVAAEALAALPEDAG
ncbi:HEAT repeat domain-containing protein [Streptomyces sp. NPDC058734]|uniref:HEAT repeat domain-containing protein n=1 Tax=Streptomyces sp. NPDC058734 TaxID=3346615 RepID=UPI0036B6CC45